MQLAGPGQSHADERDGEERADDERGERGEAAAAHAFTLAAAC